MSTSALTIPAKQTQWNTRDYIKNANELQNKIKKSTKKISDHVKQFLLKVSGLQSNISKKDLLKSNAELKGFLEQQVDVFKNRDIREIVTSKPTHSVIINEKERIIYLPGYLRLKVKNFTELKLEELNAQINASLIFNIYYGQLLEYFNRKQFSKKSKKDSKFNYNQLRILNAMENDFILNFNKSQALMLTQKKQLQIKVKRQQDSKMVRFTVRKLFQVHLDGDLFWSPIERINSILEITVQPIDIFIYDSHGQMQQWKICINLMDTKFVEPKMSFESKIQFGHYSLLKAKSAVFYSNQRIRESKQFQQTYEQREIERNKNQTRKQSNKINYFEYAHFNIPLFRYPMQSIVTIFVPLFLLAIINLAIFFQDQGLGDRIGSISALMIAFVAFIPTIRQQIPPNPGVVLIEAIVYVESGSSLLALIHSLRIRNYDSFLLDFENDFAGCLRQNPQFTIALIASIICFFIVLGQVVFHYAFRFRYKKKETDQKGVKDESKFTRNNWRSQECDKYFKRRLNLELAKDLMSIDENDLHLVFFGQKIKQK